MKKDIHAQYTICANIDGLTIFQESIILNKSWDIMVSLCMKWLPMFWDIFSLIWFHITQTLNNEIVTSASILFKIHLLNIHEATN